jgi:hypothetical protein
MTIERNTGTAMIRAALIAALFVAAAAAQTAESTGDAALDAKRETIRKDYAALLAAQQRYAQARKAYEEGIENARSSLPANVLRTHQTFLEKSRSDVVKVGSATYGVPNGNVDVTKEVTALLQSQRPIYVHPSTFGGRDPAIGKGKTLVLQAEFDGIPFRIIANDTVTIALTPAQ